RVLRWRTVDKILMLGRVIEVGKLIQIGDDGRGNESPCLRPASGAGGVESVQHAVIGCGISLPRTRAVRGCIGAISGIAIGMLRRADVDHLGVNDIAQYMGTSAIVIGVRAAVDFIGAIAQYVIQYRLTACSGLRRSAKAGRADCAELRRSGPDRRRAEQAGRGVDRLFTHVTPPETGHVSRAENEVAASRDVRAA